MQAIPVSIFMRLVFCLSVLSLFFVSSVKAADSRTVDTKFGAVSISGDPQRVVTLYEGALDASYAVGIKPLGAVITRGGDNVASYLQEQAQGIALVGTSQENNLEAIIALEPDLILAANTLPEQQYRLLSTVAPTVASGIGMFDEDAWRQEARLFANALGKSDAMETQLQQLDQRLAQVKNTVKSSIPSDERTTMLARWMPQGPVILSKQLFTPSLLAAVGFEVDDQNAVKAGRPHTSPISQEKLSMLNKDWLFLATINAEGDDALAQAEKSSAYQRLEVVKNKRVVPVDGQIWTSANGILAAHVILDTIEDAVAKTQSK